MTFEPLGLIWYFVLLQWNSRVPILHRATVYYCHHGERLNRWQLFACPILFNRQSFKLWTTPIKPNIVGLGPAAVYWSLCAGWPGQRRTMGRKLVKAAKSLTTRLKDTFSGCFCVIWVECKHRKYSGLLSPHNTVTDEWNYPQLSQSILGVEMFNFLI